MDPCSPIDGAGYSRGHDRPRPLPPRRPRRDRHRRLLRARRRLRAGPGRGRRRRRPRRAPCRPPRRHRPARGGHRAPRPGRGHRRRRPRLVHGARRGRDGRVRPRRRAGQQRRHRHGGARDPRDPGAVPAGDRRQPQRLLLDGAGVRPGDAAGLVDHQHLLGARADDRGPAAGGVRRVEGRADRPDPRPGPAVDRPQGHPRQRDRPRLLRLRDDRAVPARATSSRRGRGSRSAARATRPSSPRPWCSSRPTPAATSPARPSPSTAA